MAGERMEKALKVFRDRYRRAAREGRSRILNEFCAATGYHRKYAISLLNRPVEEGLHGVKRRRGVTYPALRGYEGSGDDMGSGWLPVVGAAQGDAAGVDAMGEAT